MAVEYFENPLLPGKRMFRCERLSASLQVAACAGMWRDANQGCAPADRLLRCRLCTLGAEHAGARDVNMSPLRGQKVCCRCHRTDLRLISGKICISCQNRAYEWLKGKNARGRAPVKCGRLDRRVLRFMSKGVVRFVVREHSASLEELMIEVLRDSPSRVFLGRGLGVAVTRQGSLL